MSTYLKISVAAVCAAILAVFLRKTSGDYAVLTGVAGCCLCACLVVSLAQPVVSFATDLFSNTGLKQPLFKPLLKTVGIGLLTQVTSAVCTDAGESALAKMAELGGCVMCICVSMPLMEAVLQIIQDMTGG